ncbi:UDP-glucuronosyltransferase [Bacillus sp. REN3]|uniref:MGDG synthase family glycosyltransferase n=1 Tax=Bacillus sp. REN3 TaxID=2802440 RepID=UPI001AEE01FF|nr:UDP-glucuronosyltransferase [Bacillus sp. REN3]
MKKILILPFLQMPSGHHTAAEALRSYLKTINPALEIKKMDIFEYTSRLGEKATTYGYLKAIKMTPELYSWLYRFNACGRNDPDRRHFLYEWIFLKSMKTLLRNENPDLIICTHCLPSYLLNLLKKSGELSVPVINVYTDYFINTVWGVSHIDLHLAPSEKIKNDLEQWDVYAGNIAVTGIPVHPEFLKEGDASKNCPYPFNVMVAGGNLGVGTIENLFKSLKFSGKIRYHVLCGKNQTLFKKMTMLQPSHFRAVPYISSRKEMNRLYEQMDMVLTKPGGITVSECLWKKLPVGLLPALPGQEEHNLRYLLEKELAIKIIPEDMEEQLLLFLEDKRQRQLLNNRVSSYLQQLENVETILENFINKNDFL